VTANGTVAQSGRVDEAEAWLTFDNGVIATLSASRIAEQNERRLIVTEPDMLFAADLAAPSLTTARRRQPGAGPVPVTLQPSDALQAEIAAFLASVVSGTPPDVDGAAGLAALEVVERIQTSIAEAQTPVKWSV
jgi:predicted dehydrogenase